MSCEWWVHLNTLGLAYLVIGLPQRHDFKSKKEASQTATSDEKLAEATTLQVPSSWSSISCTPISCAWPSSKPCLCMFSRHVLWNCQYMSFLCSNVCCFLYWMSLRNDATWFQSSCTWVRWLQIIMVLSDADLCREIVCKASGLYRALWGTFTFHISHNICLLKTWLYWRFIYNIWSQEVTIGVACLHRFSLWFYPLMAGKIDDDDGNFTSSGHSSPHSPQLLPLSPALHSGTQLLVIPSNDYTTWQWVSRMQHLLA